MKFWAAAACLSISAVGSATAHAQDCSQVSEEGRRAVTLFAEERFREALDTFVALQRCSKDPVIEFNIARSHERLGEAAEGQARASKPGDSVTLLQQARGHLGNAERHFVIYLQRAPNARDAPVVRERVLRLREKILRLEQQLNQVKSSTKKPEVESAGPTPSGAPWVLVGAGATVIVGAVIVGALAQSTYDDAVEGKGKEVSAGQATELEADADKLGTAANVLFAVGGGTALAGTIWGIQDLVATGSPSPGISGAGISLRFFGRW